MSQSVNAKLLLCDADDLALEEILPLLRERGFSCTYVQNADEIVVDVEKADVVLLNSRTGGGATAVLGKLREFFPAVPVIVLDRCRSLAAALEFFRAGAADYLPLPLSPEEMQERIWAALKRKEGTVAEEVEVETAAMGKGMAPAFPAGDAMLSAIPCGVLLFDAEGILTAANPRALSLLGEQDVTGLADAMRHRWEEWEPLDEHGRPLRPEAWLPHRVLREKAARSALVGLQRPDRTRVWLRLEAAPIIVDGRCQGIVMAMVNITEEYSEIRRLRTRLSGCSAAV